MRTVTSELNNSKDILNSPTILSKTFHSLFLQLQIHIYAGAMMPKTGLKILLRMGKWLLWINNCLWDPGDYQTTQLSHTFDFFHEKDHVIPPSVTFPSLLPQALLALYFSPVPSSLPPLALHLLVPSHLCRAGFLTSFDLSQNCCASHKVSLTSLSTSPHRPTYSLTQCFVFLYCIGTTGKFTI